MGAVTFSVIIAKLVPLFVPGKAQMKQAVGTQKYLGGNYEA